MKKPVPTQTESPFGFDELFFSTTDPRGVITFGNDVFNRVSGYEKEILKGSPHSIIRHPDMPRAVFKLFWDTIKAGEPIAAYVKNMAADGSYYWVFAFVFPIENGYISIRLKPSSSLFKAAQSIYAETLNVESNEDINASLSFLLGQLKTSGFHTYKDFMIRAAFAELTALQECEHIQQEGEAAKGAVAEINELSEKTSADLHDCFNRIEQFQETNQNFLITMDELSQGFQHLKFIALNMTVAAAKFGQLATSLGVVAKEFSELSEQIRVHLSGLDDFVKLLSDMIQKCALIIVALDAQMLMVDFFIKESIAKLQNSSDAFSDMINNRGHFSKLFQGYANKLETEVTALESNLAEILEKMTEVQKFTTGLEVIRQIGAVESARVNEIRQVFVHYLEEMVNFISLLRVKSKGIEVEVKDIQSSCKVIRLSAATLAHLVDRIFDLAASRSTDNRDKSEPIAAGF